MALEFSGENDGAILFKPPAELPRLFPEQQVLRRMREAPETGYSRRLKLPLHAIHENDAWFFYCRTGGRYCKGVIMLPTLSQDRQSLESHMHVWMNPEGGRDLRAKRF